MDSKVEAEDSHTPIAGVCITPRSRFVAHKICKTLIVGEPDLLTMRACTLNHTESCHTTPIHHPTLIS